MLRTRQLLVSSAVAVMLWSTLAVTDAAALGGSAATPLPLPAVAAHRLRGVRQAT